MVGVGTPERSSGPGSPTTRPSRVMARTSPMRSRLMRSPATTVVQSLHDRRAEARSPADLCVPFLHNAVESFNRAFDFGTHCMCASAKMAKRRSCGHGVVEQRYTQNSNQAFVPMKILRTNVANCVCNKPLFNILTDTEHCASQPSTAEIL